MKQITHAGISLKVLLQYDGAMNQSLIHPESAVFVVKRQLVVVLFVHEVHICYSFEFELYEMLSSR
jgi:hypothetical protein